MSIIGLIGYIDAGTGTMVLQWIIAASVGLTVFFRHTVVAFLRRMFGRNDQTEQGESAPEDTNDPATQDESHSMAGDVSEREE